MLLAEKTQLCLRNLKASSAASHTPWDLGFEFFGKRESHPLVEPGEAVLKRFILRGRQVSEEALKRYVLMEDVPTGFMAGSIEGDSSRFGRIYYDAPFNFCLVHTGCYIASVGFVAYPDQDCARIKQIQGGPIGSREFLAPFRWEHALVSFVMEWARQMGIPKVHIIPWDLCLWGLAMDIPHERLQKRYDLTAESMGFVKGKKDWEIRV